MDRGDDARISAAAAQVPLHGLRDLIVIRVWIFPEQRNAGDDHARGAVAALHGAGFEKRLLQRMHAAIFLEAFDGGDVAARGCGGRHPAGAHGSARPCMGVMWRTADAAAGIRQERTATPSMMTVHAPHCPSPQPYLAPVRSSSSRSMVRSVRSGSALTV